jgi:L-amino acid N-acyltransferase YncA
MEVKDANLSHTLQGKALDALYRRATRQGKQAVYVVVFRASKITATIHIARSE